MSKIKDYLLEKELDDYIDSYNDNNSNSLSKYSSEQELEEKIEKKADAYYRERLKSDEDYGSFIWNNEPRFNSKATPGGCLMAILFEAGIGLLLYLIFSNL